MAEDQNFLRSYYEGITRRLQIELDFLNGIIRHRGELGEANETLLTNLLIRFLPKKYSFGSGLLVDRNGNVSRQIDIVVYDSHYQPELFSQLSTVIFPVDVVYMAIEVKSLLNRNTMAQAIENIRSVKRLGFIPSIILEELPEQPEDTVASFNRIRTSAPLGVIFGYRGDTPNHDTFESWITQSAVPPSEIFDLCYVMNSTFFYTFQDSDNKNQATTGVFPLSASRVQLANGNLENVPNFRELSNESNPIVRYRESEIVVDQAGGFLNFLTSVYDLLSLKPIIRRGILRDYLENNMLFEAIQRNYNARN